MEVERRGERKQMKPDESEVSFAPAIRRVELTFVHVNKPRRNVAVRGPSLSLTSQAAAQLWLVSAPADCRLPMANVSRFGALNLLPCRGEATLRRSTQSCRRCPSQRASAWAPCSRVARQR